MALRTRIYTSKKSNTSSSTFSVLGVTASTGEDDGKDKDKRPVSEGPSLSLSMFGDDDDDEDSEDCTICFAPLMDGDRVGVLPCNHLFHVDCLKEWLQRRNVCPLCQSQDIATPRYDDPPTSRESDGDEEAGQVEVHNGSLQDV